MSYSATDALAVSEKLFLKPQPNDRVMPADAVNERLLYSNGMKSRSRVRREQERGEVDPPGIERELRPHRAPVSEIRRSLGRVRPRTQRERASGQTGTREDLTPRELGHDQRLRHDAVHLEAFRVLAIHVHAVDACEIPDVLRVGIAPVLL